MNSDLTPKQQASEAIRQAESILIVSGSRPNIDQVSAMAALAMILRKFGKKVTALASDGYPSSVSFVADGHVEKSLNGLRDFIVKVDLGRAEVDKLKYTIEDGKLNITVTPFKGGFSQNDVSFAHGDFQFDLIIAIGVTGRDKLDRIFTQNPGMLNTPVLNLDYHRINQNWAAINLVDTNAATLSEMLVSLAESLQNGLIDEPIATAMLTGIIASTDRFSAPHTTAKAMTVAAQLMAAGAKQQNIIKSLYGNTQRNDQQSQKKAEQPKPQQPAPAAKVINPTPVAPMAPMVGSAAPVAPIASDVTEPTPDVPSVPTAPVVPHVPAPAPAPSQAPEPTVEVPTAPTHNPLEVSEPAPEPEQGGEMSQDTTVDLPNEGETPQASTLGLNPYKA